MASILTLDDVRLSGRTVLVRVDVNSPLHPITGEFLDDSRLRAVMPTLRRLADAKVVLLAHQSRPGKDDFTSTERHADLLGRLLGRQIRFVPDVCGEVAVSAISGMQQGEMLFLDNVRKHAEEIGLRKSTPEEVEASDFVTALAPLAAAFVFDAFASAHRNSPSISGFGASLPSIAGDLMQREIQALSTSLYDPQRPCIGIFGGIKVDDSVAVMENMLQKGILDEAWVVGGVANLFLELAGIDPGPPSVAVIENELGAAYAASRAQAERLLETHRDQIRIPSDVAINKEGVRVDISIDKLPSEFPIWDLGIGSSQVLTDAIMGAGTMIVNGPAGVFESDAFAFGTIEILNALAESEGVSIIGGGHTSALVVQRGLSSRMGHVSTGGGACLDILSGAPMPACEALERSKSEFGARLDELGLT